MKKLIVAATLFSFVAAPLIGCGYDKDDAKNTKASLSTHKHFAKGHRSKADKTVAAAQTEKAKI